MQATTHESPTTPEPNNEPRLSNLDQQREVVSKAAADAIATYDYASKVDPRAMRWEATYATDQSTNIAVIRNGDPYLVEVDLLIPGGRFYSAKLWIGSFATTGVTSYHRDEARDEVHTLEFSQPNALRAAVAITRLATRKVARAADAKVAELVTLQNKLPRLSK